MSETDFSASHDPSPSGSLSPSNDAPKPGQGISYSGLPSQKAPAHFTCADCGEISIRFTANKRFCSACVEIRSKAQARACYRRTTTSKPRAVIWTPERKQEVIRLHGEGKSASEIAKVFGATRNAVIGLWYRMGLSKPRQVADERERQRLKLERQRQRRRANPHIHREANKRWREAHKHELKARRRTYIPLSPEERKLSTILPEYPASLNHTIIEVTGCRFMPGEGFLCCGQPRHEESSYCERHERLCHAE